MVVVNPGATWTIGCAVLTCCESAGSLVAAGPTLVGLQGRNAGL